MYYSNEERKKEILKFVKENQGITKSKVIEHMTKRRMSSLVTTQTLLDQLTRSGKIKILKDKPNSRNHKLFFNAEDEFNRLFAEIASLEDTSNKLTNFFVKELPKRDVLKSKFTKQSSNSKRDLFNLIFLYQFETYGRITSRVSEIERTIKSQDDREALYRLLPNLLLVSDKLNSIVLPSVESAVTEMIENYKEAMKKII